MITARWVAAALITLFALSLVWAAVGPWLPPSPNRVAPDSYSARGRGYRALYDLADHFGLDVRRNTSPPGALFDEPGRLVLLEPILRRVELEHKYLERMAEWTGTGGELVFASGDLTRGRRDFDPFRDREDNALREVLGDTPFEDALGLRGLEVELLREERERRPREPGIRWSDLVRDIEPELSLPKQYAVRAEGDLAGFAEGIAALAAPRDLRHFTGDALDRADGRMDLAGDDGETYPVLLLFRRDAGHIVLLSEPLMVCNLAMTLADNPVLGLRLVAGDGRTPVVIDEYYQGILTRAGAFALLGLFPYGAIALFVLAAVLVWAWRLAPRFGPPAARPPESRRSVTEYIEAMARLFERGRKRAFALHANRTGAIDAAARAMRMRPGSQEEQVLTRLDRLSPDEAERFRAVLNAVDAALQEGVWLDGRRLVELQRELDLCRKRMRHNRQTTTTT